MQLIKYTEGHKLTNLEIQLVAKLNENIKETLKLSINKLALKLYISPSSLSRLVRKLGFKNYNGFIIWLSGQYQLAQRYTSEQLENKQNNPIDIITKIYHHYAFELEQTYLNIEIDNFEIAINWIHNSSQIIIYGPSDSNIFLKNFNFYLNLLRYHTILINYFSIFQQLLATTQENDLFIIYLYHEQLIKLPWRELYQLAHEKKIKILLFTNSNKIKNNNFIQKITLTKKELADNNANFTSYASNLMTINFLFELLVAKYHLTLYQKWEAQKNN
ncbi:MurR/RpiR family transcriptional regulator [Spiroplasma chrysopicola]|uniref:HTH rpiR-type domain-containing protein n=1 Tax=Spiroplasma chrysopicola DF-1 TaxID=1276227 RepID=R4UBG5_9MOLU|nr:MurR/RpiR family transcriptional regulator [Spiroplasma chrysopicola]AGM25234.1 hypothetical protein SCHRY_v1c06580 [Spiroplasma chrysopicola DF-1]